MTVEGKNKLGIKNISYEKIYNRYVFKKDINGICHKKYFKTLSEAIAYKEIYLTPISHVIEKNRNMSNFMNGDKFDKVLDYLNTYTDKINKISIISNNEIILNGISLIVLTCTEADANPLLWMTCRKVVPMSGDIVIFIMD